MSTPEPERRAPSQPAWLRDAERVDVAVYAAIARTPTPALDEAMTRLTNAANYSRLWLAAAAIMATVGGRRGGEPLRAAWRRSG